jgi:hypothetical protein
MTPEGVSIHLMAVGNLILAASATAATDVPATRVVVAV